MAPRFRRGQPSAGQPSPGGRSEPSEDQFSAFRASLLYCPQCRQATPTRERLLLVLPTGNLYEYLCVECGTSTGSKTDKEQQVSPLIIP
ncbi:MAG: cytoplasmic protein [Nitrospira sp.]|nr:cytoplasmic protein [Nitrospira sp.]